MFKTIFTLIALLMILFGLIIMTRKKFMMRSEKIKVIVALMPLLAPSINFIEDVYIGIILVVIIPMMAIAIMVGRNKYFIVNINNEMISSLLMDILKEKNISYEERKKKLILTDYDNRTISYTQSLNTVELNLKEVKHLYFYKELKEELKYRIENINTSIFPSFGVFMIGLGLLFLVII
ncbi:hypothetical protein GOQ27_01395 [Clostridium sp. D2Q-11]|uniref:Uncharacterized protein n=1 Tax=Anaeromonas frigoriresistens TaxID=2683708 RepID=A0A942Z7L9_9FIRM|nr:hypothetical protein [Anaeromonas frigoriresistens]MBS4537095.1 hypothetical protein [Anaeromonas frigoriresistens]